MAFQQTHARLRPLLERRDHGFRWRGKETSRLEGLSDAVFGFAITLLVVSLEAPRRFADLQRMMHGFTSFAVCFVLLLMIWHAQYVWFRRYALEDAVTFVLNTTLLFVVAFYVYPLKFLFTLFVDSLTGYRELDAGGQGIEAMSRGNWTTLMMIYSAGFAGIYAVFTLLYLHAHRLRERLGLDARESFATRVSLQENLVMLGVGVAALACAVAGKALLAGLTFALIGPLRTGLGISHARARRQLIPRDGVVPLPTVS